MKTPQSRDYGWQDGNASEPSVCFYNDGGVGLFLAGPGVMGQSGAIAKPGSAVAVPLTGATVAMSAGEAFQIIDPAGTLAALTVTLPPSPVDGQIAGFSTSQELTALTLTAPGGATVAGAPTTLLLGGATRFIYRAANTTWYPY